MSTPSRIYTSDNCKFSAPLQWSLTLFWKVPDPHDDWLLELETALESDGIRILNHRFIDSTSSQIFASTLPATAPNAIIQRSKGRLYYLVRDRKPKPFRRNYAIRSVGNITRETIEGYVANQLGHHRMADPAVQTRLFGLSNCMP